MEIKQQKYFGQITAINEEERYVDAIILHFDKPNLNGWSPMSGCLDDFLRTLTASNKFIPACYQHDENKLIGQWRDLVIDGDTLKARCYLDNIPFVNETVIPQLKSGSLQGASPTLIPTTGKKNAGTGIMEVAIANILEFSLVSIPADLDANILTLQASLEIAVKEQENIDFEIELLTL